MDKSAVYDSHVHFQIASGAFPDDGPHWYGCCCATGPDDWETTLHVSGKLPGAVPYLGVHPWFIDGDIEQVLEKLESLLSTQHTAGVGEIGLDGFRAESPVEIQRKWFGRQMKLAVTYKRPVSIHCVRCWGPLIEELSALPDPLPPFLVHGFNGSREIMERIISLGGMVSFSPFSLRGKSGKSASNLAAVQDEHFLLDTDFPYALHQPFGEYPGLLSALYETAAKLRGTTTDDIAYTLGLNMKPFLPGAVK